MSTETMTPEGANPDLATVGSLWRHKKSGGFYRVVMHCTIEATLTPAIAYKSEAAPDATVWIRPAAEFMDGRFERQTRLSGGTYVARAALKQD